MTYMEAIYRSERANLKTCQFSLRSDRIGERKDIQKVILSRSVFQTWDLYLPFEGVTIRDS